MVGGKRNDCRLPPTVFHFIAIGVVLLPFSNRSSSEVVCLPAVGFRSTASVNYVGQTGTYWSSTAYSNVKAYVMYIDSSNVLPGSMDFRDSGYAVRLVTDSK